jgi:hypothetical protein
MIYKKTSLLFFLVAFMISCGNDNKSLNIATDFKKINVNNLYTIKLPKYMDEAKEDLNDVASLQYENQLKETYLLIIDESKKEYIDSYRRFDEYNEELSVAENYKNAQLELIQEGIKTLRLSEPSTSKINGLDVVHLELDAKVEGVFYDITYFFNFIEGKENMYMIMAWTLTSEKDTYREVFKKAASTFSLLEKKKKKGIRSN